MKNDKRLNQLLWNGVRNDLPRLLLFNASISGLSTLLIDAFISSDIPKTISFLGGAVIVALIQVVIHMNMFYYMQIYVQSLAKQWNTSCEDVYLTLFEEGMIKEFKKSDMYEWTAVDFEIQKNLFKEKKVKFKKVLTEQFEIWRKRRGITQ